jgi:hypothetical protein
VQRILGLPDEAIVAFEVQIEAVTRLALQQVADQIARHIESLSKPVVGAGGDEEPPASSVPEGDGLPPGQPYVSPDDLAQIPPLWQQAVADQILPIAAQVFQAAVTAAYAGMVEASGIAALPAVSSIAAEQYLAQAANTFDEIGDSLWGNARNGLLDGFQRGESIPQLGERVRQAAGVTARTGVLVARTQVIEASNAGSYATAVASELEMQKEWIATPDLRTRPTHLAADGQRVGLKDMFVVGGESGPFPASNAFSPAERYSCRCTVGYVMTDAQVRQGRRDAVPEAPLPGQSGMAEAPPPSASTLALAGNDIRPELVRASTLREVDMAAMAEARRLTGRDIRFDQTGADVQIAREQAEGILRGLERYPESPVSQVGTFGPGSAVPGYDEPKAFSATLPQQDVVLFNVRMASDPAAYRAAMARGADNSWHAPGTATPMGQALHEFGHTVDATFTPAGAKVAAVRSQMTEEFTGQAYKEAVRGGISRYAASKPNELGAEAFADVMVNGERASAMSRAVFDAIDSGYTDRFPRRIFPHERGGEIGDELAPAAAEALADPRAVRRALRDAGGPEQLAVVWQDEMRRITGREIPVEIAPAPAPSMATMRQYAEGILQSLERYPEAKLRKVGWWYDGTAGDYARVRRGTGEIQFNALWASDAQRQKLLASLRGDVKGWQTPGRYGWSVRGATTPQATAYHEFAHILDVETLGDKLELRALGVVHRRAALEGIDADTLVARDISAYAGDDTNEMLAEAWTDVMVNGEAASAVSRELYDLIGAEYRARGLAIRSMPRELDDFEGFPKPAAPAPDWQPGAWREETDLSAAPAAPIAAPPVAIAPARLAAMKVADLRALAAQRGIEIPTGARKADLVRLLEAPGPDVIPGVAPVRAATRAPRVTAAERAAVKRQAVLTERDKVAQSLAEVDEMLANQASERALAHRAGTIAARVGDDSLAPLTTALEAADTTAIRAAIEGAERRAALTVQGGRSGEIVRFDRATQESIGEAIPDGAQVMVLRPGYVTQVGRERVQVMRARVMPATPEQVKAIERQATRAAARERSRVIEQARGTEKLLAEVDELVANKAAVSVIRQRLDPALIGPEQVYAGADPAVLEKLRAALDSGDPAKLRSAITRSGSAVKIKPIGKAGAKVKFDPDTMESVGGVDIPAGAQVTIVRRGATLPDLTEPLTKARVTTIAPKPVKAAKLKPVKKAPTKAAVEPAPESSIPARRAELRARTAQRPTGTPRPLGGGSQGEVELVKTADGEWVRKVFSRGFSTSSGKVSAAEAKQLREMLDAEQLGPSVLDALGVRASSTVKIGDRELAGEFIEGQVGQEILGWGGKVPDRWNDIRDSPEGRLMGLADYLMGNTDRNSGNWIITPDGHLAGIDHSYAFSASMHNPAEVPAGDFGEWLQLDGFRLPDRIPIDPADLAIIRARLESLRAQFTEASRSAWFNLMMRRVKLLEERAIPGSPRLLA